MYPKIFCELKLRRLPAMEVVSWLSRTYSEKRAWVTMMVFWRVLFVVVEQKRSRFLTCTINGVWVAATNESYFWIIRVRVYDQLDQRLNVIWKSPKKLPREYSSASAICYFIPKDHRGEKCIPAWNFHLVVHGSFRSEATVCNSFWPVW